jgi:tRNA(Ile2) C34 agmatinyltransferase TiaS
MASPTEFHASIADATNEQHENMSGLVQDEDFNAEVIVRFLRDNGIDAHVDEPTGGFRFTAADLECADDVVFACVCLRASISYALEAAFWCIKAKR